MCALRDHGPCIAVAYGRLRFRLGTSPEAPGLASLTKRLAHQANCPCRTLGGRLHSFNEAPKPPGPFDGRSSSRALVEKRGTLPGGAPRTPAGASRRCLRPSVALLLISLVLLGCSDESTDVAAPTSMSATVPQPTPTTAATTDPVGEIVDRYKQFWDIRFEVNQVPVNPGDPRLPQFATGQQLDNVLLETRQRRDKGLALRRPDPSVYVRRVKLVSVNGETASLQDCVTNDGIVYRVATGEVVDDSVVTRNLTATMRRVDGTWRLAETRVLQEWEGVAGCALSSKFS